MRSLLILASVFGLAGCATIVKSDRQSVQFTGGLENGQTKVRLPDGNFDLTNGSGLIVVTRSKDDIPIEVTCNGVAKKGVLPTRYDIGWAGAGNLIFGGIPGWIIDAINPKGYNVVSPYSVHDLCEDKPVPPSAAMK